MKVLKLLLSLILVAVPVTDATGVPSNNKTTSNIDILSDTIDTATPAPELAEVPVVGNRIKELIRLFKEGDAVVRINVVYELGEIGKSGNKEVIQFLFQALKDESGEVRRTAIDALGKIGGKQMVQGLVGSLTDEYEPVRRAVVKSLDNLNWKPQTPQDNVSYIYYLIEKRDSVALVKIGPPVVEHVIKYFGYGTLSINEYVTMQEVLIKIGQPAIQPLIAALQDKDLNVVTAAARTLGKIGDKKATQPLIVALKRQDWWPVREAAAYGLGNIGDKQAVPFLIESLKDQQWQVRAYAAESLGKIGDKRATQGLIEMLTDKNRDVRKCAAKALGKMGDAEVIKVVVERWIRNLRGKDIILAETAAEILGEIGDRRALHPLIKALKHGNWGVRCAAAEALGNIGDKRAIHPLVDALRSKEWWFGETREHLVEALGKIGDKQVAQLLIDELENEQWGVRCVAAEALGNIGDEQAIRPLIAVFSGDEYEPVRNAAEAAIEKIRKRIKEQELSELQKQ